MDRNSFIFCAGALAASLLIVVIAFPYAAMSETDLARAKSVVKPQALGEMDLGAYGKVSVSDLVSYYIENPPEKAAAGPPKRKVRFEGC